MLKISYKISSGYVNKVYIKWKWSSCRLGSIPKISHYVYASVQKKKKSKTPLVLSIGIKDALPV